MGLNRFASNLWRWKWRILASLAMLLILAITSTVLYNQHLDQVRADRKLKEQQRIEAQAHRRGLAVCPEDQSQRYHNCYGKRFVNYNIEESRVENTSAPISSSDERYHDTYEGEFQHDLPEGYGALTSIYEGNYEGGWKKGEFEGDGTITDSIVVSAVSPADKGTYTGHFEKGKRTGFGVYKYDDGRADSGCWENDKLNGPGIRTEIDGSVLEKGFFTDGKLTKVSSNIDASSLSTMCGNREPTLAAGQSSPSSGNASNRIPMKKDGSTYSVSAILDDTVKIDFVVDSGASTVAVSEDVFNTLQKAGVIAPEDMLAPQDFLLADGSKVTKPRFMIRKVQLGGRVIHDVEASVSGAAGSLLLGQSALEKLGTWSIDYQSNELVLQ